MVEVVTESYLYVGAIFFQRYYALFDIKQRRIGIARNNDISTIGDLLV